ncbi:cobalt-factor II C(20)-methyltransferase [Streptococcus danieliae]|uniref:cobalt-factor II C(20)-methyltransferase n=1 Tax=Streptococcus danieliae TaxID=747656 RepID=UPI0026ED8AFB|nr:cobalt-factor II C(20)-methyltransferase [Streptococcus danieliae]
MAKFYGIGVGPGDSDLVTVKAVQCLANLDILYTPESRKNGKSLALSIVGPHLSPQLCIKQRHFPMISSFQEKNNQWSAIAREIISDVKDGWNVGFVTLGDPMVYSTYSYLLERIGTDIETETLSGIPSFIQLAATLQLPLTMDDQSLAVIPATASEDTLEQALLLHDTVVIMKVANHMDRVRSLLERLDLLETSHLVSKVAMEDQEIKSPLSSVHDLAGLSYFSTVLVTKRSH